MNRGAVLVDFRFCIRDASEEMTNDEIHSTIFGQRWRRCTLRLTKGDAISVTHPDYLLMPPARNWVLYVKPEGKGLQFVPTLHIAAIDLEIEPVSA